MVWNVHEVSPEAVNAAAAAATSAAYAAARIAAVELVLGAAVDALKEDPQSVVEILLERDQGDPRYQLLGGLELDWALLVVRILDRVLRPTGAVSDARSRGATWAQVAAALGVTAASAQQRFKDRS